MASHSGAVTVARGRLGSLRAARACCAPARGVKRPWPAAQGPRARACLHRHGREDAAGAAAHAGRPVAVPGRAEAVTAASAGSVQNVTCTLFKAIKKSYLMIP